MNNRTSGFTIPVYKRETRDDQSSMQGTCPLPRPSPRVPRGRGHDAAALLCAAAVGVVAEAQAVADLVGHGDRSADGELRMVLEGAWVSPRGGSFTPGPSPGPRLTVLTPPELSERHMPPTGASPTEEPRKVRPLKSEPSVNRGGAGALAVLPAIRAEVRGTHVSSCVESCGRRAHSSRRHCRKSQSVAFASAVTRLRSCSVHTSRPVSTT